MGFLKILPWLMIIFGGGGVLVLIPLILGGLDFIVDFSISYGTRIVEGTPTWSLWQKIPIPVYLRVRVFDITNPKDIAVGAKPIVREMGPYVYLEKLEKVDIKVDEENDTLTYRQIRHYHFVQEMSKGKETDKVTFLNIAFVGVAKIANDFTDAEYLLATIDDMLVEKGEKLTRTHTIRELLFDGFTVKSFLDLAREPLIEAAGESGFLLFWDLFGLLTGDIRIPNQLMDGKMGILEGRNGSDDGLYQVRSGRYNSRDFGRVVSWNGFHILDKWNGDPCNAINGTDGILYQPFLTEDTVLEAFVPDICRTLTFRVSEEVSTNGFDCLRYRMESDLLSSVEINEDNWCFCHSENLTHCNVNGIASVAPCFEGAPIYFSNPHFYGGDPILTENVVGLEPNFEKHVGYFDLHPRTGVPIQVRQRLQFNVELKPWLAMPTFAEASYAIVPILWIEEGGDLDDFLESLLFLMEIGLKIWKIMKWVSLVFQFIMFCSGIAIIVHRRKAGKVDRLNPQSEHDDESESDEEDTENGFHTMKQGMYTILGTLTPEEFFTLTSHSIHAHPPFDVGY